MKENKTKVIQQNNHEQVRNKDGYIFLWATSTIFYRTYCLVSTTNNELQ